MSIDLPRAQWRIERVSLPLTKPIPVGQASLSTRTILRVQLEESGLSPLTLDCSPLPGFHPETLVEAEAALRRALAGDRQGPLPKSVQTTLEILDWAEQPQALRPKGRYENTALLRAPLDESQDAALIEELRPHRVCKVKLSGIPLTRARSFLKELAADRPDRELRLDFNQSGFQPEELRELLKGLPVATLEEPSSDLAELLSLSRDWPLALDESLGKSPELDRKAAAWVIKPNVLGWNESLRRFADSSGVMKILSNTFESHETLQLYAYAYSSVAEAPVACGFGTAYYLADAPRGWDARRTPGAWPEEAFPSAPRRMDP